MTVHFLVPINLSDLIRIAFLGLLVFAAVCVVIAGAIFVDSKNEQARTLNLIEPDELSDANPIEQPEQGSRTGGEFSDRTQATVRGTDKAHNLEQRGSTPRPAIDLPTQTNRNAVETANNVHQRSGACPSGSADLTTPSGLVAQPANGGGETPSTDFVTDPEFRRLDEREEELKRNRAALGEFQYIYQMEAIRKRKAAIGRRLLTH